MGNIDTITELNQHLKSSEARDKIYGKIIALLHQKINDKNIYFSPEFKGKWNISEDNPMIFDDAYFEAGFSDELFVFYAAVADNEVFSWLEHAYNSTHDDKLSIDNITEKINSLLDSGVWSLWITEYTVLMDLDENGDYADDDKGKLYRYRFFYVKDDFFEIKDAQAEYIDDDTIQIRFIIDAYGLYNVFTAITKKVEAYKVISQYVWNKKFDKLFELVREDLDNEISDWLAEERLKDFQEKE